VVPDFVAEACDHLDIPPVRDAFGKAEDAFAQPWDYATAVSLWANPPFSRMEEVVAKAAREGCHMLVIAPEWPGPQYPWWASLCGLCPNRWCLQRDRPIYPGGSDLVPAPKWRIWAFMLDSRSGSQA